MRSDLQMVETLVADGAYVKAMHAGDLALALDAHWPAAVRAAAPFYGLPRNEAALDWAAVTATVQSPYAELDQGVTLEWVREFEATLIGLGKAVEILVYEGAHHGFFNDTNARAYPPVAAAMAWERTVPFLKEQLGGTR